MTDPAPRPAAEIACPYCLTSIRFNPAEVFVPGQTGGLIRFDFSRETNRVRLEAIMANAQQRCVDPADGDEHFVPVPYLVNGSPLTIAFVGRSGTGKTNLLGAMLTQLERLALAPFGLTFSAVNQAMHTEARTQLLERMGAGEVPDRTDEAGHSVEFLDALLVQTKSSARPVGFFDVAGEDLLRTDRTMRFLAGVSALVFVIDPVHALRLPQLAREAGQLGPGGGTTGDPTFGAVLDRMPRTEGYIDAPAAVVLAKSDLVRHDPPVDRWLQRPLRAPVDPVELETESRDVYAFVDAHGGGPWLRPVTEVRRCTLHFASATGSAVRDGRYPVGARGQRPVQPLLALFAMCGLLGPQLAEAVGG